MCQNSPRRIGRERPFSLDGLQYTGEWFYTSLTSRDQIIENWITTCGHCVWKTATQPWWIWFGYDYCKLYRKPPNGKNYGIELVIYYLVIFLIHYSLCCLFLILFLSAKSHLNSFQSVISQFLTCSVSICLNEKFTQMNSVSWLF